MAVLFLTTGRTDRFIMRLRLFFILVLSFSCLPLVMKGQRTTQSQYEVIILSAEQLLAQKNYKGAKAAYENALKLDLKASYPRLKLQQIKQYYNDPQDDTRYRQFVAQADQFYAQQEFDKALEQYEWALVLKPQESYPRERQAMIEEARIMLQTRQQAYKKSLALADSLFKAKNYSDAQNEYLYASGLLPKESYPRKKLDEINIILEVARREQLTYAKVLSDAEQAYMHQDYYSALSLYRKALQLRPGDPYPGNMIKRIGDAELDKLSAEEAYKKLIGNADKYLADGDLQLARANFEQASNIKPTESYPKKRLIEIDATLEARAKTAEQLAITLDKARKAYDTQDFSAALSFFETARQIEPSNQEAAAKITEIKQLLKSKDEYNTLIVQADRLFNAAQYNEARARYQQASTINTAGNYPGEKINEIDSLLQVIAEKESAYKTAVEKGDAAANTLDYASALTFFRQATEIKPIESYPPQQIARIEAILRKAEADRQAYEQAVGKANGFMQEQKYPEAIEAYTLAMSYGPATGFLQQKIAEANALLSKAQTQAAYEKTLEEAKQFEEINRLAYALRSYQAASQLKPDATLPKQKVAELTAIIEAENRKVREAYEKQIATANRFYESKVFDQAIEAYSEAAALMPDVAFPSEMIDKIKKYIEERTLANLVITSELVKQDDEKKFSFKPIELRQRRNNYVVIKVKFTNIEPSRFFLNYGLDDQRSGGIVVRNPGGKTENEFIVRVSAQDRWYRIDNNYLSIFAEGDTLEITQLIISAGD